MGLVARGLGGEVGRGGGVRRSGFDWKSQEGGSFRTGGAGGVYGEFGGGRAARGPFTVTKKAPFRWKCLMLPPGAWLAIHGTAPMRETQMPRTRNCSKIAKNHPDWPTPKLVNPAKHPCAVNPFPCRNFPDFLRCQWVCTAWHDFPWLSTTS